MKKTIFFIFIILLTTACFGQQDSANKPENKKILMHAVYGEARGLGGFFSLNYDAMLNKKWWPFLISSKIGIAYTPNKIPIGMIGTLIKKEGSNLFYEYDNYAYLYKNSIVIPFTINFLFGRLQKRKNHFLESDIGPVLYLNLTKNYNFYGSRLNLCLGGLNYRYQKYPRGYFFKIGINSIVPFLLYKDEWIFDFHSNNIVISLAYGYSFN